LYIFLRKTDIRQSVPDHPSFKKRTVKIVSGWSCDLSARVGILPDEMAGLYQTIDSIGDGSA